jgi:ketopantoate reductase
MKTLIFGAGPLGSLYAARLHEAGQDVTLLARRQRLTDLHEHGVVLEYAHSGRRRSGPSGCWSAFLARAATARDMSCA